MEIVVGKLMVGSDSRDWVQWGSEYRDTGSRLWVVLLVEMEGVMWCWR